MARALLTGVLSLATVLAVGCGDDSGVTDAGRDGALRFDGGAGIDGGPGTDGGPVVDGGPAVDGGPGTDGGSTGPCPTALPARDGACEPEGLVCGYGDDPRALCRPYATCTSSAWVVTDPGCEPLPPATCPPTREDAADADCTPEDAYCAYDGVPCRCTNCVFYPVVRCMGPLTWHCDAPPAEPDCPTGIPNSGTQCTAPGGTQCVYGCEENMSRTCTDGVWVPSSALGGCPMSTRRAKRDITYLEDEDRDRLADEVLATRLATYEYTDPALDGRRRLGFILEDQSMSSFATDPERDQVDLYGYVSMLVAVVQKQQREIDALRDQVDRARGGAGASPSQRVER